jgi:5-formyltetrahydrofolate cyclo-ligase
MTKDQIRKIYLQKRLQLSEGEFQILNRKIADQFFMGIDLSFIGVLHSFLPIEKQREVNTWLIIERIRREFPNVRISIPKVNNQTSMMDSYYFEGLHQLEKNTWGIPEPKQGIPTPTEKINAVLVPLLGFDKKGNRVGYGRGFYDKFLALLNPECVKIGLSLFPPVEKINDVQPYDVPLNIIVTPAGTVTIKASQPKD